MFAVVKLSLKEAKLLVFEAAALAVSKAKTSQKALWVVKLSFLFIKS